MIALSSVMISLMQQFACGATEQPLPHHLSPTKQYYQIDRKAVVVIVATHAAFLLSVRALNEVLFAMPPATKPREDIII